MGRYVSNYVAFFIPVGREPMVEALKSALSSQTPQGLRHFDLNRILKDEGRAHSAYISETDLRGEVLEAPYLDVDGKRVPHAHYGYDEMGPATKLSYTFEVKYRAPQREPEILAAHCEAFGIGLYWYVEGEAFWDPKNDEHANTWEVVTQVFPSAITETELAMDDGRIIDFTQEPA